MQESQKLESHPIKVVLCGESGVGKSQLFIKWFAPNNPFSQAHKPSTCASFISRTLSLKGKTQIFQIWDTPGDKQFADKQEMFRRGAKIGVFIFDVSDASALVRLQEQVDSARKHMPGAVFMLVPNKIDLHWNINVHDIDNFCKNNNMVRCSNLSVLLNVGINDFDTKIFEIAEKIQSQQPKNDPRIDLLEKLDALISYHRNNSGSGRVKIDAIVSLLKKGVNAANPQQFFDSNLAQLKQHLTALQWTGRSMFNTLVNLVLTVLAALSIVGLPLLYCMGLWQPNAKNGNGLQHSFRFFSFGDKQTLQLVSEDVADDMKVALSF